MYIGMLMRARFILILMALMLLCAATSGKEYTADYWFQKGNEFFDNGSVEIAIDCYNKSVELDSTNKSVWLNKGLAFANLENIMNP